MPHTVEQPIIVILKTKQLLNQQLVSTPAI